MYSNCQNGTWNNANLTALKLETEIPQACSAWEDDPSFFSKGIPKRTLIASPWANFSQIVTWAGRPVVVISHHGYTFSILLNPVIQESKVPFQCQTNHGKAPWTASERKQSATLQAAHPALENWLAFNLTKALRNSFVVYSGRLIESFVVNPNFMIFCSSAETATAASKCCIGS